MNSLGRIAIAATALALASGCSSIQNHRGFIVDEVLVQSVQPGIDNRRSVEGTLGRPTFTSAYGDETWYYISSTTEQRPFGSPEIERHMVLAVQFDAAGDVIAADRTGIDQVARIDPDGDETPTLGSDRGFLEDLFGNIGRVGAPGAGAPPQ